MTLNIAHRGASGDAPENTFEAFALALEQGADMIETDLHASGDGAVPLCHDSTIDGAAVAELSLSQIRARAPCVPTLEETLDRFGAKIGFNLELKRAPDADYAGLEARVLGEVRKRGLLARTLFSSFYDSVLARLRELEPDARIGLLVSQRSTFEIEARAHRVGAESVHPERPVATPDLVDRLHAEQLRVHVFTVDDPDDMRRLIEWGVDGIFTNVPARLAALLAG